MAKTKTQNPNKKASIFLCCFGPPPDTASTGPTTATNKKRSGPIIKKKRKRRSWISWLSIRIRNTSCKTVPLEDHYSNPKPKPPKSTLRHNNNPQAPTAINSPPPPPPSTLALPPQPATPYYTPSQTRHGASKKRAEEDTRQQGRGSPNDEATTTLKSLKSYKYEPMVGMSIIVVTLLIMVFWGRLCAILCTSAWLYYIPRFTTPTSNASQNDVVDVDVDLDSEEYKKKVIMDGILERKRGVTITTNK